MTLQLGTYLRRIPVTANYSCTLFDDSIEANTQAGALTVTLPDATQCAGKVIKVTKVSSDTNAVTVNTVAPSAIVITQLYESYDFTAVAGVWMTLGVGLRSSQLQVAGGKNILINGGHHFWQRGTSLASGTFSSGTSYLSDRWTAYATATGSLTNTYSQVTDSPNGATKYAANLATSSVSGASLTNWFIYQKIELSVARPLLGKKATASFWYKSNRTGTHAFSIYCYNGPVAVYVPFTVNSADTWEYKTISLDFTSYTAGSVVETAAYFEYSLGLRIGTVGQASISNGDYIRFTQAVLNEGTQAAPFSLAGGTIAGELAACQRYFYMKPNFGQIDILATQIATTGLVYLAKFPVTMRTIPATKLGGTFTLGSTIYIYPYGSGTSITTGGTFSVTDTGNNTTESAEVSFATTTSWSGASGTNALHRVGMNAGTTIAWDAEL